jgi:hypothetical protein
LPTLSIEEFNAEVKIAFDQAVLNILGEEVLGSLYMHLQNYRRISPDEVPYRLDSLFDTLQHTFGVAGARTLSRAIAKRIYLKFHLSFPDTPSYRLQDYIEQAKRVVVAKSV